MHGDQARAADYDDPMCARLLGTAADVLRSFGSAFGGRHLAIVGGAVPSLLAGRLPAGIRPHVGAADLDLHLSLHLLDGETADYYQAIIDGLQSLGMRTDVQNGREVKWRWVGRHRDARLQVEFLCPMRSRSGRPEKPIAGSDAQQCHAHGTIGALRKALHARGIGPRGFSPIALSNGDEGQRNLR
jgi:hypothetical protein